MWGTWSGHIHRDRKRDGGCQGRGEEEWEVGVYWGRFQFGMIEGVLELDGGHSCTTMCMYLMPETSTLEKRRTWCILCYIHLTTVKNNNEKHALHGHQ